jgi:hypothetical protein
MALSEQNNNGEVKNRIAFTKQKKAINDPSCQKAQNLEHLFVV